MKRIIPYKLFESNVPFTRENIQKSIRDKINEKEVESIITDMCADFMDEYNVAIHFDWGWVVYSKLGSHGESVGVGDFRKDSNIEMFRRRGGSMGALEQKAKIYLKEVDESTTRYVEVLFDRYDRGSSNLKIWKEGFDLDFINIMDFVRNYFPNIELKQQGSIGPEAMGARFNVIFK